jgi:hypothetical protein
MDDGRFRYLWLGGMMKQGGTIGLAADDHKEC